MKAYITTYYWCCQWQLVDLYDYGFTLEIMNKVHPPIHVSEWYCARWDCGSIFQIMVALLNKDFKFLQTYKHSEVTAQWEGGDLGWRKVTHTFQDYKAGVRYVLFVDGGKDTQFWAGHYGSKWQQPMYMLSLLNSVKSISHSDCSAHVYNVCMRINDPLPILLQKSAT